MLAKSSHHDPSSRTWPEAPPVPVTAEETARQASPQSPLHFSAAVTLTALLMFWTFATGTIPSRTPQVGAAFLVLNLGALLTAWLAASHVLPSFWSPSETDDAQPAHLSKVLLVAVGCMLIDTAILVAGVIA